MPKELPKDICLEITSGIHSYQDENNTGYFSCIHCGKSRPEKEFEMSLGELRQLMKFLNHEYISHEFFPLVHVMMRRANTFLDDWDNELPNRVNGVNR